MTLYYQIQQQENLKNGSSYRKWKTIDEISARICSYLWKSKKNSSILIKCAIFEDFSEKKNVLKKTDCDGIRENWESLFILKICRHFTLLANEF